MALGDFVRQLLCNEYSCEVDPLRLGASPSSAQLERNRQQLLRQVEAAWRCVLGCQDFFPHPLRLLFANLRQRLEQAGRAELADNREELAQNLNAFPMSSQCCPRPSSCAFFAQLFYRPHCLAW